MEILNRHNTTIKNEAGTLIFFQKMLFEMHCLPSGG